MKILIIGAGPAGCYTGKLLAHAGHDVEIYEEHEKIGFPIQCTGILTQDIFSILRIPKNLILAKARKTIIFAPKEKCEFSLKGDIVINRAGFDEWLADRATKSGAKIFTGTRFMGISKENKIILKKKDRTFEKNADILIGADGPLSPVAKASGIYGTREFLTGIQAVARLRNQGVVEFYPHLGTYAWVVPESKSTVRIGLAAKKNAMHEFEKFIAQRLGKNFKKIILCTQAGLIPLHNPKNKTSTQIYAKVLVSKTQNPKPKTPKTLQVYLVGDAALQIKNTTGGGIVPGLKAAEALARSINCRKNYEKEWRASIGNNLYTSYILRNTFDKFSNHDWDELCRLASSKNIKELLRQNSRDKAFGLVINAVIKEPRFLKFMFKVIS